MGERLHGVLVQISSELVSMATDSSHRVIMTKMVHHIFSNVFDRVLFILAGNDDMHESFDEFEILPDSTTD